MKTTPSASAHINENKRKTMKNLITILGLVLIIGLNSCGNASNEDMLQQAEADLLSGQIERAVSSCNELADTSTSTLTATQMCRIAIIYAKASDLTDLQDYMATAADCYRRAQKLDVGSDSLARYVETLNIEDQSVVHELRELTHILNTPRDYSETIDTEERSITNTVP